MQIWSDWLKKLFPKSKEHDEEKTPVPRRHMYILLLVALGILLLILNRVPADNSTSFFEEARKETNVIQVDGSNAYGEDMARRLQVWLEAMDGVGRVEVFVTLERDEKREYAQERTVDRSTVEDGVNATDGQKRTEERITERPVLVRKDQGRSEEPIILTTYQPTVRGVAILAEGADNAQVRYDIMQAVQAALGVPAHRIQVFPRRGDS